MENQLSISTTFMTASNKPILISTTSMQRAEQIMFQCVSNQPYDPFYNDDVNDEELCRICDELENSSQNPQTQPYHSNELKQTNSSSTKRKRLGISTTPIESRVMMKKN